MSIKKNINNFLSVFGLGIHRVKKQSDKSGVPQTTKAIWNDFEIKSPIEHNTSERMNDFFSDKVMVDQYLNEIRISLYKEIVQLTVSHNVDLNNKDIVDVGCGTGHLLSIFLERYKFKSITGIDFSASAIEVAKRTLPEGDCFVHDLYESLNRNFDVVLCTEVLEHLLDPEKALRNILEMMSDNSVCLLTVPNGRVDIYRGHINFWSPESWKEFLKKNCTDLEVTTGALRSNNNNYAIIRRFVR